MIRPYSVEENVSGNHRRAKRANRHVAVHERDSAIIDQPAPDYQQHGDVIVDIEEPGSAHHRQFKKDKPETASINRKRETQRCVLFLSERNARAVSRKKTGAQKW